MRLLPRKGLLKVTLAKTHNISDIDNIMLDSMAKNMGILVNDNKFATFDLLKDLESAHNCLKNKHLNMSVCEKM